jgi:CRISPR-associated protein Cmr3
MRYVATITPLEPYTFGTEQGSKYNSKDVLETGKESYIMETSFMPEQTTILGTLRYIVLANKGLLRSDYNYADDKSEINAAIGSESFSFFHPDRQFGVIKSISPVYIVAKSTCSEDKKTYIPNPFCNKRGLKLSDKESEERKKTNKNGFVPIKMSDDEVLTTHGKRMSFPDGKKEYDAKEGHGTGFIELSTRDIKMEDELFAKNVIVGNRADSRNQDNKDGFFKREIVSFNHESENEDNVKYSFAVEIEAEENSFPNKIVAYMGKKRSAFLFEFDEAKEAAIDTKVENALQTDDSRWYYALSDLYLENYEAEQFAIVEKKKIRNLETNLSESSYVKRRKKSERRITLIKAGSVFRQDITDIAVGYKVAGYNHIIKIGGNN